MFEVKSSGAHTVTIILTSESSGDVVKTDNFASARQTKRNVSVKIGRIPCQFVIEQSVKRMKSEADGREECAKIN